MYHTIFFATDGNNVTEGDFKTKEEAQSYINDIGSRWIFYPFAFVCTDKIVFTESGRHTKKRMKNFIEGLFIKEEYTSDDMYIADRLINNF